MQVFKPLGVEKIYTDARLEENAVWPTPFKAVLLLIFTKSPSYDIQTLQNEIELQFKLRS